MQGMNIRIFHQLHEGNHVADYLAKLWESGNNQFYEGVHRLQKPLKGILRIDRSGLPAIRWFILLHLFIVYEFLIGLFRFDFTCFVLFFCFLVCICNLTDTSYVIMVFFCYKWGYINKLEMILQCGWLSTL